MKCPHPAKFRNCTHGQVIPETKERAEFSKFKEKEEKLREKQISDSSMWVLHGLQGEHFILLHFIFPFAVVDD